MIVGSRRKQRGALRTHDSGTPQEKPLPPVLRLAQRSLLVLLLCLELERSGSEAGGRLFSLLSRFPRSHHRARAPEESTRDTHTTHSAAADAISGASTVPCRFPPDLCCQLEV